jgi:hypothetical protein
MMQHLRAFAEALFSDESGAPPPERMDWLIAQMEDYLVRAGSRAQLIFTISVMVVAWLAPLFVWRFPTISSLDLETRVKALTKLEESFAGAPVLAVKAFLCVVYYEHPDVQREVGHLGHATFPMELMK